MSTPFAAILRKAVERTPGALGSAFAARDGELVDVFVPSDVPEWDFFTAHYGILLSHVQSALRTFHYGEAELMMMSHSDTDVLLHPVIEGYYALMAVDHPAPLGKAISALDVAAKELRLEMG